MKKSYQLFGFAAIAALLLPGCSKDATDDVVPPGQETIHMIVVPREKVEALSDDGTRTYWDEEFSDIKWCKDEKFAFCINGVGHWLTGMPRPTESISRWASTTIPTCTKRAYRS